MHALFCMFTFAPEEPGEHHTKGENSGAAEYRARAKAEEQYPKGRDGEQREHWEAVAPDGNYTRRTEGPGEPGLPDA